MTNAQITALCILLGALILFASNRLRHDLVAMATLLAVVMTGLVDPSTAFNGFGHPAVITVAAVLMLSAGLNNSGVVDLISNKLDRFSGRPILHMGAMCTVVAIASAFMNNVGALALMLPVALSATRRFNRSPAMVLMPLAFSAILGGMITMIGTPPNIIVASFRETADLAPFGMFDFTPVGLSVAAIGVLFIVLFGWRFIPKERRNQSASSQLFEIRDYIVEMRISETSPLVGDDLRTLRKHYGNALEAIGIERDRLGLPPTTLLRLEAGDIIILRADPSLLDKLSTDFGLEIVKGSKPHRLDDYDWQEVSLLEAVVTPNSELVGRGIPIVRQRLGGDAIVIAVARQGQALRKRLREVRLHAGDIILLQGEKETLHGNLTHLGLLPLAPRGLDIRARNRVSLALAIFGGAILISALGWMSTSITFAMAAMAYVLTRILPVNEMYEHVDWSVVVLLGAMFPLGMALEQTETTKLIAGQLLHLSGQMPTWAILTTIMVITMWTSDIINNAATALIMSPIALGIAEQLNTASEPFLMVVAVGASCAFNTPIGHQCNTLVLEPGGYRFTDYWRMGLPLDLLIVSVSIPLILYVWPL
ncbi:MAG: SLC13 family permease [Xanthomonadales bacterium]|jgi:di/tricarboxylate transporter|nr:SLC13 family permease [Xanthomonadales bacterium]